MRKISPFMLQSVDSHKQKIIEDISMSTMSVTQLGSGQVFGDIDLVYNRHYVYSLRATSNDCQLYILKSVDFERLLRNVKYTWTELEECCT